MKKIIRVCGILLILILLESAVCNAEETGISVDGIIKTQEENLKISDFLRESKKYSNDLFDDIDIQELFSNAMSGDISNINIGKYILKLLFGEIEGAVGSLGIILLVILIHSILKSVSDGLNNSSVSEIAYFASYIFIVTIIMKNFSDIIETIKLSIESLVTFINSLLPIMITLLIASGGIVSGAGLQTTILAIITLFANIITKIIIPFSLVAISIYIISSISSKVQVEKLSKFINSSIVWILGIILTIFVGITSLESSIGKRS